jgi:5-methylcytosine-specific restriction protein A
MPRKPGERFKRNRKRAYDRAYEKARGTPANRGYDSAWREVRRRKLSEEPLCEICLRAGHIIPATEVHHIVPIADGGDVYARENLMSVCHSCHMKLHAELERRKG